MDLPASGGVAKVVALANKTLLSATTAAIMSGGDPYVTTMLPSMLANNGTGGGDGGGDDQPSISMDNLYPALVQCFAIIICG